MVGPIFRPEVLDKQRNRMLGSANQRQNPALITGRGRPTTGANATATTNPNGATTQRGESSPIARSVSGTLQSIAGGMNAYEDFGSSISRLPQPSTRIGKAAPGANGAGISGESPFPTISSGIQDAYNRFNIPGIVSGGLQGASSALNELDDATRKPIQNIGSGVGASVDAFHRTDLRPGYGNESGYAAPGADGAGISGRPILRSGLGFGGMMSRGGAVAQQPIEPEPFVNAGTPQYQGGGMKMGGNEDLGSYENGIFYGADKPFLPRVNLQDPQYQMQGFDMAGNPVRPSGGGLGPYVDADTTFKNPRLYDPQMPDVPMVDYFGNRDRRPRQIDRPLTPREAQDVNQGLTGTRGLTGQMNDVVASEQARSLQGKSPLRPVDPDIAAMEEERRRVGRQGSILENTPIATDSFGSRQNSQNLPSDMRNSVTTGPGNRFNGNIGYANSPDRATPNEIQASARQSAESQAANRVREGNDSFGDRFRGGSLGDYAETGMTWQERQQAADDAADQPNRDRAQKVMLQKRAEREAFRAANPEMDEKRRLAIAQASADREARHNAFKEQSGGLNYRQFDRLTKKEDSINRKISRGLITPEEGRRQLGNEAEKAFRRASGASNVAQKRLSKMPGGADYEPTVDRTRLPNGDLPEATRNKAAATAKNLVDPDFSGGSPKFKQSKETLANVGIIAGDSAASASKKIASAPFPLEDPAAAMRTAMAYRMYWGSNRDAVEDWNTDQTWGASGFASERIDPQFAKMMNELTQTPVSNMQEWIDKYSGHLAMFGQDASKYEFNKPKHNMAELNERLPENASPFPGRFGGY